MPKIPPEIQFENHVRDELLRRFKNDTLKYSALEQGDITDTVNFIAADTSEVRLATNPRHPERARELYRQILDTAIFTQDDFAQGENVAPEFKEARPKDSLKLLKKERVK